MSTKNNLYLLILFIISACIISCDDDNKEKHPKEITFNEINLKDYTKEQEILFFIKKDTAYTVNSKADLDKIAIYKNGDEVDFGVNYTKNTLLIIQGISLSGISKIDKTIVQQNEQEYVLNVHIHQNLTSVVQTWVLILSIPKTESDAKVTANVKYGI